MQLLQVRRATTVRRFITPTLSPLSLLLEHRDLVGAGMRRASAARQNLRFTVREMDHGHWIFEARLEDARVKQEADSTRICQTANSLPSNSEHTVESSATPLSAAEDRVGDDSNFTCLCPSFDPKIPSLGIIFAVVVGDAANPRVVHLPEPIPLSEDIFNVIAPFHPSEVFRIASTCIRGRCKNFENDLCHLGKAVASDPGNLKGYSECSVRGSCRWWIQEGRSACEGCSGVVTINAATIGRRFKNTDGVVNNT